MCIRDRCEQHATVPPREIYNVGVNEQNFQKQDIGDIIQKRLPQAEVVYNHKAIDKRSYKVNFGKIKQHLNFSAIHSPEASVDQIISGLESGLISQEDLARSVNVTEDDAVRADTAPHQHKPRSRL
eukprot:TRINITY_DN566_c0_g3_i2.p1 TRINITY_DN566_c0_g3~~TRINITY_DN566_c0_g3_i2.p1  ORF type:complete len:126 (+),score=40.24 TRINITY_DN566_c0_g3_i2:188-565(+)